MVQDTRGQMSEMHRFQAQYMPPPPAPPPVDIPGDPQQEDLEQSTNKMERFRAQFWKTQMCRFYKSGCRNGSGCVYAHGSHELSVRPDLTKTSICKNWEQGKCELQAHECGFAHGHSDLKTTPMFERRGGYIKDHSFERRPPEWQNEQAEAADMPQGRQQRSERRPKAGSWNRPAYANNLRGNSAPSDPLPCMMAQSSGYDSVSSTSWVRPPGHQTTQPPPHQEQRSSRGSRAQPKAPQDSSFPGQPGFHRNDRNVAARPPGQLEGFASPGMDMFSGNKVALAPRYGVAGFNGSFQVSREVPSGFSPQQLAAVSYGTQSGNNQQRMPAAAYSVPSRQQPMPRHMDSLGGRDISTDMDPFGEHDIVDLDAYRNSTRHQDYYQPNNFANSKNDFAGTDIDMRSGRYNPVMGQVGTASTLGPSLTMEPGPPQVVDVSRTMVEELLAQAAPEYYDD